MTTAPEEPESDPELSRLLQEWTAPGVPDTLDARVQAMFRARRRPLWRRFFTTSVRVPLPVAVALVAALIAALLIDPPKPDIESAESAEPTRAARYESRPGLSGSLAGFEPVREMNVTVLPGSATP